MALLNQSVQVANQLGKFFETLVQGTAPANFSREHLKDIGFSSSNHHALIPLLKGLGFLTADGTPTDRYKQYLDKTKSRIVMAQALKEAYSDIFVIKAKPGKQDKAAIEGKYKSTYNQSEISAQRSAATFLALLELADQDALAPEASPNVIIDPPKVDPPGGGNGGTANGAGTPPLMPPAGIEIGLRYNIQIHLPATKDVEVYNAIFKSIREHLIV